MIGELIFPQGDPTHAMFVTFFATAAAIMLVATGLAAACGNRSAATAYQNPRRKAGARSTEPIDTLADASTWRLMRTYWPGSILVVALCLAFVQTMPIVFIERFVDDRKLNGVTLFFAAYSPTAIILRLILRHRLAHLSRRRTLLFGMACYVVGLLLLIPVHRDLDLLLPAIVMGTGHCFSYPFLVDLAAERMPKQHRGVATAVVLGALDVGFLLGFLIEGQLIERCGFNITLAIVAALATTGVAYHSCRQRTKRIKAEVS